MIQRLRLNSPGMVGLVLIALCLPYHPVGAHHASTGFAEDTVTEISGTIKEFQFTNPHSWIQVLVEDENGEIVEWSLEWGSPNRLGRNGVFPSTFPAGAEVTMRLHPMRNGSPAGAFIGAKFADGSTIGDWEG